MGMGCHSLLQGIFLTQGLNPGLPHCRQILYQLSHQGSPRILEWVAYFFFSGSSRLRNRTEVSCIAGGFFISWATREAPFNCFSSVQFSPVAQSCHTLCNLMDCTPSPLTNPWSLPKFKSIESLLPSNHLILCHPLRLPPSIFPNIRVFSNESALCISGQSIGISALSSVLPINTQNWSPLGWTGWISLLSKGLSRVFSSTTIQNINSSALRFLYGPTHIHIWLLEKL